MKSPRVWRATAYCTARGTPLSSNLLRRSAETVPRSPSPSSWIDGDQHTSFRAWQSSSTNPPPPSHSSRFLRAAQCPEVLIFRQPRHYILQIGRRSTGPKDRNFIILVDLQLFLR